MARLDRRTKEDKSQTDWIESELRQERRHGITGKNAMTTPPPVSDWTCGSEKPRGRPYTSWPSVWVPVGAVCYPLRSPLSAEALCLSTSSDRQQSLGGGVTPTCWFIALILKTHTLTHTLQS